MTSDLDLSLRAAGGGGGTHGGRRGNLGAGRNKANAQPSRPRAQPREGSAGPEGQPAPSTSLDVESVPTSGPLEGLRVVECACGISGPYCGRLLADLGAEVVKVEPPQGDPARRWGPFYHDDPSPDLGLLFNFLNVNKYGVTLDLGLALGRDLLARLIAESAVFVFSGEAAEVDALGLGFEILARANPSLVAVYVTPFGLTGPYRERRGGELVAFHMSGLGYLTPGQKGASKDRPPIKAGGHQALMTAGQSAAIAALHALFAQQAVGTGQMVDVSELEAITSFQFMDMGRWVYMGDPGRRGEKDFGQRLRCKDGEFNMTLAQDHMWRAWVEVMGNPQWAERPEYATRPGRTERAEEIQANIEKWAADHTKEEIYRMGQARRVPVFPENSIAEAVESAQIAARGFLQEMPLAGGPAVRAPSSPYQFQGMPWTVRRPAPRLGEHNREILCGRLGLPEADLPALYETHVI